jgi:acetyl esterase/lipase
MRRLVCGLLAGLVGLAFLPEVRAAEPPRFTRTEDVIYGRKFGTALTMDVFTPTKNANGAAIIWVVSGGWFSSHAAINPGLPGPFLERGYTVFAVVHGSQPKFTIPEAVDDMKRSVRFIRANAERFKIDPDRIGVTGGSAGGHLSLMLGTANEKGNSKAQDPVDKADCRVQAVACFFPPTDFVNYGDKGKSFFEWKPIAGLRAPFDFEELDPKTGRFVRFAGLISSSSLKVKEEKKVAEILHKISPINHVSKESAPSLIIHGDADRIVPIQQAEIMVARLKEAGVPAELVAKKKADHGWQGMDKDLITLADWFDKYLKKDK